MKQGNTKKKIAPIVVTILVILYMRPLLGGILMAAGLIGDAGGIALTFPLLCWLVVGGAVIVGVLRALFQRLREIDGGEEEDAKKY